MYFFYFDESGSRDPSRGTAEKPKDHIYVLLAVGMYERQWKPFERDVSGLKLELASRLRHAGKGSFELADCEIKSNWLRLPEARQKSSLFLTELSANDLKRITDIYFAQISERKTVIMVSVIDKRYLYHGTTLEEMHQKAYEFLLERIQHYLNEYHPKHQGLIVMDDTGIQLNRSVAMRHSSFQRYGNWNMRFPSIVEYPFFTRSELSNGVQLADQLAYNVYRAFKSEDMTYPFFENMIPRFYRSRDGQTLHGLKVWPDGSPLVSMAQVAWEAHKQKALQIEGI